MLPLRVAFCALALTVCVPLPALAQQPVPTGFADLVEKLSPAVVNISTTQKVKGGKMQRFGVPFGELPPEFKNSPEMEPFREFFDRFGQGGGNGDDKQNEHDVFSLGSGFVIDAKGFVITNNHVIDDADEVTVTFLDNTKYKAKIIGRDKKTDLALLKIEAKKDLPFVPLGNSDEMRVGDWVIAIGNPFGLGGSVTQGIISARARSINSGPFDDFLQTDAPINKGNSGGPLFNVKGEVIGINSAIFSPSGGSVGIGFSIPTELAKPIIAQLKEFGRTHRGWLGVKIQEVSEEVADSVGLSKPMGALVLEVSKGSPADKAGIIAGDVITAFDGKEISEMRFLPRRVAETKIGKTSTITYWRKNASKTVDIKVGELDESADDKTDEKSGDKPAKGKRGDVETVIGMDITTLTPSLREEFGVDAAAGVIVVDVASGSEASKRGVRAGDVIVDVNNEAVTSPAAVTKAFEAAKKAGRKFALVKVARGKETAFITLPTN
ncbi:MAG: DegQ family serine endoprotease [Alphaproteobacteria bacterium]|nr:DegQ family serine endoprotease [Alphaproteobacteria bacterium]